MRADDGPSLTLAHLQSHLATMYGVRDQARGLEGTFLWFMEEVGELSAAIRKRERPAADAEFADVLAWLATLANVMGVDLTQAVRQKYGDGCPGCGALVCACDLAEKP